jgi:glutamate dehydrogenase (NAD(P)+)
MPKDQKQNILRAMASSLRNEEDYIFAPDMGTDEECMAWIKDEVGRVVGLPREVGGIPLDEIGATGFGLSHVVDVALKFCDFDIEGARIVIQGFGAVGKNTALFLRDKGAKIVATADSQGGVYNINGLDIDGLIEFKSQGQSVTGFSGGKPMDNDALIDMECDIWIPAARPDVIHDDNVDRLNTKLVVEGANIPVTHSAEKKLHERGVLCVPDFIANAGGVICAAMEYQGSSKGAAFETIEEKLRRNTQMVLDRMKQESVLPRQAAMEMAMERVKKAMSFRRFSLFSTAPGFK